MSNFGHNSGDTLDDDLDTRPGDWIALSRKVREHPVVGLGNPVKPADPKRGSCSRFEAWFDLLCLAQWKPSRINNKGQVITLDVGQLMGALPFLADRWNWTVAAVRWFLSTLEREEMISRASPNTVDHDSRNSRQPTNKCNVITIRNYSRYQLLAEAVDAYVQQAKQQANDSRTAAEQQANSSNLTLKHLNTDSPPFPPPGGDDVKTRRKAEKAAETRKRKAERAQVCDEAFDVYNKAAAHFGFYACESRTDERRARMLKRLDAIGGIERFRVALRQVGKDEFLSGRAPGRDGKPFRLDIDRLLSTGSGLGDVLARLLDLATDVDMTGPNGKRWGWWRGKEAEFRSLPLDYWRRLDADQKPNGTWPWWVMGAPPGHEECMMPAELVAERGYTEIYQGKITHD